MTALPLFDGAETAASIEPCLAFQIWLCYDNVAEEVSFERDFVEKRRACGLMTEIRLRNALDSITDVKTEEMHGKHF